MHSDDATLFVYIVYTIVYMSKFMFDKSASSQKIEQTRRARNLLPHMCSVLSNA